MNTISRLQFPLFTPPSEWVPPDPLPDLTDAKEIAIDLETRDPDLKTQGPGWPTGNGEVVGIAVAVEGWFHAQRTVRRGLATSDGHHDERANRRHNDHGFTVGREPI